MKIRTERLTLKTSKQFELVDITDKVLSVVSSAGVVNGSVLIYAPHTTASVAINHNEPLLMQDIMKMLYRLAPVDMNYSHDLFEIRSGITANERSNGHAHVKSFLLGASETIPIENGEVVIGERQSIFFVELDGGRSRNVVIQAMGE